MKKFFFLLIVWSYTDIQAQELQTLSLAEAVAYAIAHAPDFQNVTIDQQIAQAKVTQARSQLYPTIHATLDYRHNIRRQTFVFPGTFAGLPADQVVLIQQGAKNLGTAALDLTIPLLDAASRTDVKIAQQQDRIATNNTATNQSNLQLAVSQAYYSALLNSKKIAQTQQNLQRTERFYQDQQVRYNNQRLLKTDLNRAYLDYANAKLTYERAQDDYTLNLQNLKKVIGMEEDTPLQLSENLETIETSSATLIESKTESVLEQRSTYKNELLQKELHEIFLSKTRLQYFPVLSVYGYAAELGQTNRFGDFFGTKHVWFPWIYAGVKLTVPIFDGFQKRAVAQEQRLQLVKNENTLHSLRQAIRYELDNTATQLRNSVKAVTIQKENVKLAEEIVAQTKIRFNQQQATSQDVMDAEATLQDTQFSYLQALYDLVNARLNWEQANGKW